MNKKIKMEVSRVGGKTFFKFEIDNYLEDIFKRQQEEIRDSVNWVGLKFYSIPSLTRSSEYKNLLVQYNLIDDFGSSLYSNNGIFNVAFLRTVGGKGQIQIASDIPFATVSSGIRNIVDFLKKYYEEFLKDYKVKGFVTFEI